MKINYAILVYINSIILLFYSMYQTSQQNFLIAFGSLAIGVSSGILACKLESNSYENDSLYKYIKSNLEGLGSSQMYITNVSEGLSSFDLVLSVGSYLVGVKKTSNIAIDFKIEFFDTNTKQIIVPKNEVYSAIHYLMNSRTYSLLNQYMENKKGPSAFQQAISAVKEINSLEKLKELDQKDETPKTSKKTKRQS